MYKILWESQPVKFLKKIPKEDALRIVERIESLKENPRNENVVKLKGKGEQYRARQGDYRIRFWIMDDVLKVGVIDIDHRKDVYRK